MRKSWCSVSRQYISGLHKSTITTGNYYCLAEFHPHLSRSLSSEGLPLTVVAGIEAVLSDNDWQLQAHGFCDVLRPGVPGVPVAVSGGDPDSLQGAYSLSMASYPLANSPLSQMSIETFVVYNLVAKLVVKLGVLKLFQTRYGKETRGHANPFLKAYSRRVSFCR